MSSRPVFDERDRIILHRRADLFDTRTGPRVGDYVDFADGVTRRISHVYDYELPIMVQTSDSGSWYLGEGYCSFSGSLHPPVSATTTFTRTDERRQGDVWFFHHDYHMADNGVYTSIPFTVYQCSLNAKKATQ